MTPAIAALVFGGILLVAGWQNRNVLDVALGREGKIPGGTVEEAEVSFGPVGSAVPGDLPSLTPTPSGGGGKLTKLIDECNRIDSLHKPYKWGGGHASFDPNGPWDCSGAVSRALHAADLLGGVPRTSGLFMTYGDAGRGQHVTVWANLAHVLLEIDGRMWGTSHSNPGGGAGWHPRRSTSGFTPRHPKGL
jgi:hypothetical protein